MHITTVNYQETFNLGNYCSQRIGVEITLNEGEDAKQALETARLLVHEYHSQTTPEEEMRGTVVRDIEPIDKANSLVDDIRSCKNLNVLESYRLIVRNKPELQQAYDEQYLKLSK